jgi:hypothetical protein
MATRQGPHDDDGWRFEHDDQRRSENPATRRVEETTAQQHNGGAVNAPRPMTTSLAQHQRERPIVDESGSTSTNTAQRQGIRPTLDAYGHTPLLGGNADHNEDDQQRGWKPPHRAEPAGSVLFCFFFLLFI